MRNAIKIRQNAFSESNLFTLDLSRRGRHFIFYVMSAVCLQQFFFTPGPIVFHDDSRLSIHIFFHTNVFFLELSMSVFDRGLENH